MVIMVMVMAMLVGFLGAFDEDVPCWVVHSYTAQIFLFYLMMMYLLFLFSLSGYFFLSSPFSFVLFSLSVTVLYMNGYKGTDWEG